MSTAALGTGWVGWSRASVGDVRVLLTLVAAVALFGSVDAPAVPRGAPASVAYAPPVPGRVVRPFEQPAGPYGPGHRGVDLAAADGAVVRSAADGVVSFAGTVAGRGVVVVRHADGVRTEYEPLRVAVPRGATVARGAVLGTIAGSHAACAPARCLHWGARRGEQYLDPLLLLRALGPVRLLPWPRDG